eukprot:6467354-Amphidinium_carterae.1
MRQNIAMHQDCEGRPAHWYASVADEAIHLTNVLWALPCRSGEPRHASTSEPKDCTGRAQSLSGPDRVQHFQDNFTHPLLPGRIHMRAVGGVHIQGGLPPLALHPLAATSPVTQDPFHQLLLGETPGSVFDQWGIIDVTLHAPCALASSFGAGLGQLAPNSLACAVYADRCVSWLVLPSLVIPCSLIRLLLTLSLIP